ncbi:putative GPI-anchored protein At1g61900 isoform X2 [Carex rostrata]
MGLGVLLYLLFCINYLLLNRQGSAVLAGGLQLARELELKEENDAPFLPEIPPSGSPFPLYPSLAPSPLSSFINISTPKLSGQCTLNFTSVDSLITTTATDCFAAFAPFLANVICCPQLDATLTILIGQSSLQTGVLSLDPVHANHCLSDIQQLLSSRGSELNLKSICAMHLSNLTEGSCPIKDVNSFESVVDSSRVLEACQKVDPVNECCSRVCQNAIEEAARKVAARGNGLTGSGGIEDMSEKEKVESCRRIVVRWLSSRLEPGPAKQMLRQISNCNVNGVCPLVFPDTGKVAKECAQKIENHSICCNAIESYVSHLQKQSFITNLQALDCASSLGMKLQKMNVTANVFALCGVSLKDFSLQVGTQVSGCLLPSMPSDATLDPVTGVSFTCDLNDNIAAPWPSSLQASTSSCNKSVNFPALPAATETKNSAKQCRPTIWVLAYIFMVLQMLLQP